MSISAISSQPVAGSIIVIAHSCSICTPFFLWGLYGPMKSIHRFCHVVAVAVAVFGGNLPYLILWILSVLWLRSYLEHTSLTVFLRFIQWKCWAMVASVLRVYFQDRRASCDTIEPFVPVVSLGHRFCLCKLSVFVLYLHQLRSFLFDSLYLWTFSLSIGVLVFESLCCFLN